MPTEREHDDIQADMWERGFKLVTSEPSPKGTIKYALLDSRSQEQKVGWANGAAALTWEQLERVRDNPAGARWDQTTLYGERLSWWRALEEPQRKALLALTPGQPVTSVQTSYLTQLDFQFQLANLQEKDADTITADVRMHDAFWLFLDERRAEG